MSSVDAYTSGPLAGGNWRVASIGYVLVYVAGTVVGGLAEPRAVPLIAPAVALAALFWAADTSRRIPRIVSGWASMLLPFILAAVVIAITA